MRKNYSIFFLLIAFFFIAIISCKKTYDTTVFTSYNKYINFKVGKYITYSLDSIVTLPFGTGFVTKSYIVKDSVVAEITDNLGRKSFKVYRYQLDISKNKWTSVNTFIYTPTENNLEYVENNLRYSKLVNPLSELTNWLGNSYIDESPYPASTQFPSWNYYYGDFNQPKMIGAFNFPATITVVQYDSTDNKPFIDNGFSTYNKGYEVYADTIGLVYKDILNWVYEPKLEISNCILIKPDPNGLGLDSSSINCNSARCDSLRNLPNYQIKCDSALKNYYYEGYGIRQTILSHN